MTFAPFTVAATPEWDAHRATIKKIDSFGALPKGWHYGKGGPARSAEISRAKEILWLLVTLGFMETNAFPGVSGEIMVSGYRGRHCVDLTVETDGSFVLTHEEAGEERYHESELSLDLAYLALTQIIAGIEQEECSTWSWLTCNTITTTALEGLKISRLRAPAMALERLSFWSNVVSTPVDRDVLTSIGITLESVGNLQFSGAFTHPRSQRHASSNKQMAATVISATQQ